MNYFFTILVIAISLGFDAFSVALTFGLCRSSGCTLDSKLRISLSFGFFQFLMPIIGFWIGFSFSSIVDRWDHWIIFTALSLIGMKMILSAFDNKESSKIADISKGIPLIFASVATSIDALAVGFSFALLEYNVFWSSLIIGLIAFIMSYAGVHFGSKMGNRFFKKPEWIGGIALILLGIKFLLEGLGVL